MVGSAKFDGRFEAKYAAAERLLDAAAAERGQGLVGRPVSDFPMGNPWPYRFELARPGDFEHVDPAGPFIPCYLGGRIVQGASSNGGRWS